VKDTNNWVDRFGLEGENPFDYLDQVRTNKGIPAGDPIPYNGKPQIKDKWVDPDTGIKYEVRIHPADPNYGRTDDIFRVQRQRPGVDEFGQGMGKEYLSTDGKWYHTSELSEFNGDGSLNPKYNAQAAEDTHIQAPRGTTSH
jgi:hypothetical protein